MANRYWVGGTGTWNGTNTTNWSASSGGASGASVPTLSDSVFFNSASNAGAYTVTLATATANCLDFTMSGPASGNVTWAGTTALNVYGSMTLSSTGITRSYTGAINFRATTSGKTITTNGVSLASAITWGVTTGGGVWTLGSAFTTTGATTHALGTLALSTFSYTTASFDASNAVIHTLAFDTGSITVTGTGTVWNTTYLPLVITGTPVVNVTNATATATSVLPGALSESEAISFNFTAGTYTLTFLATATYAAKNINFTGFAGTWAATAQCDIYGNLTLSTGMTLSAATGAMEFSATSGTQTITTVGKTIDSIIVAAGVGGTLQLSDNLVLNNRAIQINGGTFDQNTKTLTGVSSITSTTTSGFAKNINTSVSIICASAVTLTFQGTNPTTGSVSLRAGTLDLNNLTLTCPSLDAGSTKSWTGTIAFGTSGVINLTGTGTVFDGTSTAGTGATGTSPTINVTSAGSTAISVLPGPISAANSISFNFTGGTYSLTLGTEARSVDFTGFNGTLVNTTRTIYGNLTLSSGMTLSSGANATTFGSYTGILIKTITSSGKTIPFDLTVNVGSTQTVKILDALTLAATYNLTLTGGTFDANDFNVTVNNFTGSSSSTANLYLRSGTFTAAGTAFNLGSVTVLFSGTSTINMTSASSKTFTGYGETYYNLNQGGSGLLIISDTGGVGGSNTITNLTNTVQPASIRFPTGLPTTYITNLGVTGTSGNLITLFSQVGGTRAKLSLSNQTSLNYLSVQDINVLAANLFYAGITSTDAGNNLNVYFTGPPVDVSVTGVSSTSSIGTLSVTATANVDLTGTQATGSIGSVTFVLDFNFVVGGVSTSTEIGTVTLLFDANFSVTGATSTGQIGAVTVESVNIIQVEGLKSNGYVGSVVGSLPITLTATGVAATGFAGIVIIWSQITPDQTPSWIQIAPSSVPGYTTITPSQSAGWTSTLS